MLGNGFERWEVRRAGAQGAGNPRLQKGMAVPLAGRQKALEASTRAGAVAAAQSQAAELLAPRT